MRLDKVQNIADLRRMAKRRLPKILFEFIESGVEDERTLGYNLDVLSRFRLIPRYLGDISIRDQSATLFGLTYASPFGIAPTGLAGLIRRNLEVDLAAAAKANSIPFVMSGASFAPVEKVAAVSPGRLWAHIYPARDSSITERIVDRYMEADVDVMVLTVDNPVFPNRERDNRNGFTLPPRMPLSIMLEALLHPAWLVEYLSSGGMPMLESWRDYAPSAASATAVAGFFRSQSPSVQTWKSVEALRKRWPRRLVLKGVQHPADARRAIEAGMDGVWVSNHGGKSFDWLPSPVDTLPAIRSALGDRVPIIADSGVRRGADMLVLKALGADFTFVARATLYGGAAGGRAGAEKAIAILRSEIDMSLAMIGANSFGAVGPEILLGRKE
jgi:isopentenyl diphosphate isomerase/L-lactate dehydrogenase-like FMN-dependent dehydrogenase